MERLDNLFFHMLTYVMKGSWIAGKIFPAFSRRLNDGYADVVVEADCKMRYRAAVTICYIEERSAKERK